MNDQILLYGNYVDTSNEKRINDKLMPRIFQGLKQINISKISGSSSHLVLLSDLGTVYTV